MFQSYSLSTRPFSGSSVMAAMEDVSTNRFTLSSSSHVRKCLLVPFTAGSISSRCGSRT